MYLATLPEAYPRNRRVLNSRNSPPRTEIKDIQRAGNSCSNVHNYFSRLNSEKFVSNARGNKVGQ